MIIKETKNIFYLCYKKQRVYTGKYIKETYPDLKLMKRLEPSMITRDFKYQEGLNIDTKKFYPYGSCTGGGLYFTNSIYIDGFSCYGEDIYEVILPDDAQVYMDSFNKAKADKIIIKKI